LVDIRDAGRESVGAHRHLARHRVGDERELSGLLCRRDEYVWTREVRLHRTAAVALSAVVTGLPSIDRLRRDRQSRRDAGDAQLVGRLLDEQLVAAWLGRRLEDAVGMIAQPLVASEQTDQTIDAVVVRLHVLVADRPIVAESIERLPLEVVGAEAQRDAAPVVRAAAEHAGAPPAELRAGRGGVRRAVGLPAAVTRVEFAERAT